ncbi:MAG: hypothetical protein AAGD25_06390 [Cyanobacteria bacterium P01_F01_bin.150]
MQEKVQSELEIDGQQLAKTFAEYDRKPLMLSSQQLKEFWVSGLIKEASYICFALMIDAPGMDENADFEIVQFQLEWTAETLKGKEKSPSANAVRSVLAKLQEAGFASYPDVIRQLTISFDKL